jgi:Zn-finger nucleic acid-binding protein
MIQRGWLMPRCPLCRSALVTITFGLYPIAICTSCNARWIQDGHQQRAINQVQEPSLIAGGRPEPGSPPRPATSGNGGSVRNRETEPTR